MKKVTTLSLIQYSLTNAFKWRSELFDIIDKTTNKKVQLIDLKIDFLVKNKTIKALIFDFDGVLSAHGKKKPSIPVIKWLEGVTASFEQEKMFILTNAVTDERKMYFSNNFPNMHFIENVRKKPYPDGILQVLDIAKCKPGEVIIIDDRILTGILAGLISGVQTIYISKPLIDISDNFVNELFFMALRIIEKVGIKIMARFI